MKAITTAAKQRLGKPQHGLRQRGAHGHNNGQPMSCGEACSPQRQRQRQRQRPQNVHSITVAPIAIIPASSMVFVATMATMPMRWALVTPSAIDRRRWTINRRRPVIDRGRLINDGGRSVVNRWWRPVNRRGTVVHGAVGNHHTGRRQVDADRPVHMAPGHRCHRDHAQCGDCNQLTKWLVHSVDSLLAQVATRKPVPPERLTPQLRLTVGTGVARKNSVTTAATA